MFFLGPIEIGEIQNSNQDDEKKLFSKQKIEYNLRNYFPSTYIYVHSTLIIIIGLIEIALQILLIAFSGYYYFIGSGIWAGIILVFLGANSIFLCKCIFIQV